MADIVQGEEIWNKRQTKLNRSVFAILYVMKKTEFFIKSSIMLKWYIVENTNETQDYTFHLPATRNLKTQ